MPHRESAWDGSLKLGLGHRSPVCEDEMGMGHSVERGTVKYLEWARNHVSFPLTHTKQMELDYKDFLVYTHGFALWIHS